MWGDGNIHAERRWQSAVAQLGQCPGVVVDLGGRAPFEGYLKREHLADVTTYVCLDISPVARPHLVGDAMRIPLADCSVSGLLCNAMLEHVPQPHRAVEEIYRVLKPSAPLLVSVPFIYPYHDRADYFRFSDDALRYLFCQFADVEIIPLGDYVFAATAFITGFSARATRWLVPIMSIMRSVLRAIAKRQSRSSHGKRNLLRSLERTAVGWYVYARKP